MLRAYLPKARPWALPGLGLASLLACSAQPEPLTLTPPKGTYRGGTAIELRGSIEGDDGERMSLSDHGPLVIYFGVKVAMSVVIEGPWLITAVTPPVDEPGDVEVRMVFDDGTDVVLDQAFTYDESSGLSLTPVRTGRASGR